MTHTVDQLIKEDPRWSNELAALREICLEIPLIETVKWGWPCYLNDGRNIVLLHSFKSYCALLFFKGALIEDSQSVLVRQTENVRSARQIRFTSMNSIFERRDTIKKYIFHAIKIEKSGMKVPKQSTHHLLFPDELTHQFADDPTLKEAFDSLTPGQQRAYLLYFLSGKLSETRTRRIRKYVEQIKMGKGIDN